MTASAEEASENSDNPTVRCIANGRRRDVLRRLLEAGRPVDEEELATYIAAGERRAPDAGASDEATNTARAELVHVHLPKLENTGLAAWNRDAGTVEAAAHPAFEDPRFRELLSAESRDTDAALAALSDERRRIVLGALRERGEATSRTALCEEVLRRERETPDPDSEAVERVEISMHHVHLPKLAEEEFVEYDIETGRVAYADHPALDEVFETVHGPAERLVDKLGGFFGGLESTYEQSRDDANVRFDWPHFWTTPSNG